MAVEVDGWRIPVFCGLSYRYLSPLFANEQKSASILPLFKFGSAIHYVLLGTVSLDAHIRCHSRY